MATDTIAKKQPLFSNSFKCQPAVLNRSNCAPPFKGTMKSERRDKWQKYHPLQCLVSYISIPEQHIPPIFLLPFPYPLLKKQSPPPLGSKSHPKPEEQSIIDLSNIDVSSDQKIIPICGYVPRLMPE